MVSLTTVYFLSVVLASIAGMGSAFLGNKIYPLSGGGVKEEDLGEPPEYPSYPDGGMLEQPLPEPSSPEVSPPA